MKERICTVCGKSFAHRRIFITKRGVRICSEECATKYFNTVTAKQIEVKQ